MADKRRHSGEIAEPQWPTDVARFHGLLLDKDELPAKGGVAAIRDAFLSFKNTPLMGRPIENHVGLREVVINFGASGYLALYRHDLASHTVVILAIQHRREDDYRQWRSIPAD